VATGAIGAAIGIWGLLMLAARLREPWLASGVVGILAHSTVDFSLQIPAGAILFFVVCAYAERTSMRRPVALPRPAAAAPMSSRSVAPSAAFRSRSIAEGRGPGTGPRWRPAARARAG